MFEDDMRRALAALCADLDRCSRQLGRGLKKAVLPAAVGVGLSLGATGCRCNGPAGEMRPAYGVPVPDAVAPRATPPRRKPDARVTVPVPPYGVPTPPPKPSKPPQKAR